MDVSIVITTYNRPDALRAAIQSVYAQQYEHWNILVIGDDCDARTDAVTKEFDARTRYINLPTSCGEQAIPNSVGMSLGNSHLIALLNHDDLWLPDHLSMAVAALNQGAELFHGRSSVARELKSGTNGETIPVFSNISSIDCNYGDCFSGIDFEPASALVFKRTMFEKIGRWHAAREIYNYPLIDWLLRIWRGRANVVFGVEISVLKLETYWQARIQSALELSVEGVYAQPCPEHTYVLQQMKQLGPDFRSALSQEIFALPRQPVPKSPWLHSVFYALSKQVFWHTTVDLPVLRARLTKGIQRGDYLNSMSLRRTKRELPPVPDFDALLDFAQRQIKEIELAASLLYQANPEHSHVNEN